MSGPPFSFSPPLPAPATLASTLLSNITDQHPNPRSVGTGCKQLDDILDGGFRYGEITGLAVADATGVAGEGEGSRSGVGPVGRSIPFQALTSHLLTSPLSSRVAYIDTSGNFSPLQLYETFLSRLRRTSHDLKHTGYMYSRPEEQDGPGKEALEERAKALLDRVLVMRVFDFVGVVEAVGEIGAGLESNWGCDKGRCERGKEQDDMEEEKADLGRIDPGDGGDKAGGSVGMIIIDSMTNVVSSMMSRDHVQGHALLTTFLRSLHHLSRTHHLSTLILNSAVATQPPPPSGRQIDESNNVSIFASTLGKPALGKTYASLLDTSLFLSRGPSGDEGPGGGEEDTVVLEVLYDRFGVREGRWVALKADRDGVELRSVF